MADLDILIPHYNDPDGLAISLKSISHQIGWNGKYRVVVVDDGSRPDDKLAVERLCDADMSITLLHNPINRGRPYTRNMLLDAIDSPYVAWLDAGDEWYPKKLNTQFAAIDNIERTSMGKPYWVTCNYDWRWTGRRKTRKIVQKTKQDQISGLLMGRSLRAYLWTLVGPAHAFRTVGWFDEQLPRLQDLDFFIRFVLHGGYIHRPQTSDALCIYHKSDIGRNADDVYASSLRIFDKHRVLYNRYGWKFCRMRRFEMELLATRFARNNGENKKARRFLINAAKIHPLEFVRRLLARIGQ